MDKPLTVLQGDALCVLQKLPEQSINCCVTSPPYWGLRDYKVEGQLGVEKTPEEYVSKLVSIFSEVKRVLRDDGTLFLNLGDSFFSGGGREISEGGCDTSDKVKSGCLENDSISGNPDGAHKRSWWMNIPDSDTRRALAQSGAPLKQILECMESLRVHLPISDSSDRQQIRQSLFASLDQARSVIRAVERLHASLESTPLEFSPPPPAGFRLSDMLSSCLSSLQSFALCVLQIVDKWDVLSETCWSTRDTILLFEELARSNQCTSGYCSIVSAWIHIEPKRSGSQSLKRKDLVGIPWMVAFALRSDGWYLRSDIIWNKPNPMPESVRDRPTRAHEYIFLLSKSPRYYYDAAAIREPASPALVKQVEEGYNGTAIKDYLASSVQDASATKSRIISNARKRIDKQRGHVRRHAGFNDKWDALTPAEQALLGANKRSVWTISPACYHEAHFATFPPNLISPCILAGSPADGIVLDPFGGSGTTGQVALELGRKAVLIELNPDYIPLIEHRCKITRGLPL